MNTLTARSTRTITGYVTQLLEYPRWFIERDLDFTNCPHSGRYEDTAAECVNCNFGEACKWLNRNRTPSTDLGSVEELVAALQAAVSYLEAKSHYDKGCHCGNCSWLREARRFLHNRHN